MKQTLPGSFHRRFLFALFCGLVLACIVYAKIPAPAPQPPVLLRELLAGKSPFISPGSEFEVFRKSLPPHEKVSFIMDFPFSPYGTRIEQLYRAQSYLAPVVLTYEPIPRAAILYCSNAEIAQKRLQETGYQLILPTGDGQGIAARINA